MEQIKILFFALTSFFTIENGRIVADKTTVTVYPKAHKIEIIQENLFSIIKQKSDTTLVLKQWNELQSWKENNISWAKELDNFTTKKLVIKKVIKPHLTLIYSNEKDLEAMGIWYHKEKASFSMNQIPQNNIKTKDGKLVGNYWVFNSDNKFTFTIEPFLQIPEEYKKLKIPIGKIISNKTKH